MKSTITPARFRLAIQTVFVVFNIYVGIRFAAFVAWATNKTDVFTPKPGAVEGFLPISALLGFRQWITTGLWDTVHPAGLTIFLALLVMALLFRKGFCGYICPIGFLSGLLDRAGRKMGLSRIPVKWVDYPLLSVKYLLTGFFLYTVFVSMGLASVQSFLGTPFNVVADAKMLAFFMSPSLLSLIIIAVLIIFTLIFRYAWCRYLCPYGALLGALAFFSPTTVSRNEETCIDCGKCTRGCPGGIRVQQKKHVRSPECIGCAECLGNCPVDGCLNVTVGGRYSVPWMMIGIGAVVTLLAFWGWARATGHWNAEMPAAMIKRFYSLFFTAG